MQKIRKRVFYIFYCLALTLLLVAVVFLFTFNYDSFCRLILGSLGKLHRVQHFQESYFPVKVFSLLRVISLTSLLLLLIGFIFLRTPIYNAFNYIIDTAIFFFRHTWLFLKNVFSANKFLAFYVLILAAWIVYNIFAKPAEYDECWTIITFVRNGILTCMSYYIAPNNHIFFSILSSIVNIIHIDLLIESRLVNLFVSLLTFIILFNFLTQLYGKKIALVSTCLFSFSFSIFLYSFSARGYALITLFSLLEFYSVFKITMNPEQDNRFYWIAYFISAILGFYTIPSFLYPFVSFNVFLFFFSISRKKLLLKQLVLNAIIIVVVLALYMPVFLINGVKAVTSNRFVLPRTMDNIKMGYFYNMKVTYQYIIGLEGSEMGTIMVLLLFITLMVSLILQKERKYRIINGLALVLLAVPLFVPVIQKVFPFSRVYLYLNLAFVISVSSLLFMLGKYFLKWVDNKYLFHVASLAVIAVLICNFSNYFTGCYPLEVSIQDAYSTINVKKINSIYSQEDKHETALLTCIYRNDYKKHIIVSRDSSKVFDNDVIILGSGSKYIQAVKSNTAYREIFVDWRGGVFIKNDLLLSHN